MENQPKQNQKEKVSKGRESALVNSLIVRIHHAVPITLRRPKEGEKKHEEEFEKNRSGYSNVSNGKTRLKCHRFANI